MMLHHPAADVPALRRITRGAVAVAAALLLAQQVLGLPAVVASSTPCDQTCSQTAQKCHAVCAAQYNVDTSSCQLAAASCAINCVVQGNSYSVCTARCQPQETTCENIAATNLVDCGQSCENDLQNCGSQCDDGGSSGNIPSGDLGDILQAILGGYFHL